MNPAHSDLKQHTEVRNADNHDFLLELNAALVLPVGSEIRLHNGRRVVVTKVLLDVKELPARVVLLVRDAIP